MAPFQALGLLFVGLCAHTSNGFVGSPSRSTLLVPSIRGPLAATPMQQETQDMIEIFKPDVIVDDVQLMSASEERMTNLRSKISIVAPYGIAALAAFSLPAASNAFEIADISSITGGASTWLDSLTGSGFYQAFSIVFLSEIGDKTFFVAALLAAKLSRFISFIGSLGALAVMSVISVIIGQVFHAVPSEIANGIPLDDVAAVIAFTYFGIKILSEAFEEGDSAMDEELQDAKDAVEENDGIDKATVG